MGNHVLNMSSTSASGTIIICKLNETRHVTVDCFVAEVCGLGVVNTGGSARMVARNAKPGGAAAAAAAAAVVCVSTVCD